MFARMPAMVGPLGLMSPPLAFTPSAAVPSSTTGSTVAVTSGGELSWTVEAASFAVTRSSVFWPEAFVSNA